MGHTGSEPTSNEEMLDAILRHQIGLMQVSGRIRNEVWALLDDTVPAILDQLEGVGGARPVLTSQQLERLRRIEQSVRGIREPAWQEIRDTWRSGLVSLALAEPEWVEMTASLVLPVEVLLDKPDSADLRALITQQPIQGRLLRSWARGIETTDRRRIMEQVRVGMVLGESTPTIQGRVRAVHETTKRNVAAITRTAVNHVGNRARQAFYVENKDVFTSEVYVATLDARTTAICRSLDGKEFPTGEGPTPPVHVNSLAEGTRVTTARGPVPIEQVRVGDLALTHRGRWRPVYAGMSKRPDKADILRIETTSGRTLWATDEHPFLTHARGWRRAVDVQPGDKLFQHGQGPAGVEGKPCVVGEADHGPPEGHEPLVPRQSSFNLPRAVVDLERDQGDGKGEIDEEGVNLVLVPGLCAQDLDEEGLGGRYRLTSVNRNLGSSCGVSPSVGVARVTHASHGLGPSHEPRQFGLGLPESGVIDARTPANGLARCARTLGLGSGPDTVSDASFAERSVTEPQFALERSERTAVAPVTVADKCLESLAVDRWYLTEVVSVTRVPYKKRAVYDLSVEEDETYVAEGVIVHNCRSTRVPTFDGDELSVRPMKPTTQRILLREYTEANGLSRVGNRASLPRGHKGAFDLFARRRTRELIGQVPGTTTYAEFLSRQSVEFQDEVLGKTKGVLFRKGGLTLDKFVDRAGNEKTIEELMRTEREAFARAGLV